MGNTTLATQGSQVLVRGDNIVSIKAGGTILAGAVVGFADSGTTNTVIQSSAATKGAVLGVALHDASSGDYVAVASVGCICNVYAGDENVIDAGDYVKCHATVTGTVISHADAAATWGVGIAMAGIAANSYGPVLIRPYVCYT